MNELVQMLDDYAKEKGLGLRIMHEPGVGLATYYLMTDRAECYIEDIYVVPEKRKSHEAAKMADKIIEIAKADGAIRLLGSVNLKAKGKEASMKVLLAYGMSPVETSGDMVYFAKEI